MTIVSGLALLCALMPASAQAGLCMPLVAEPDNPARYIAGLTEALTYAKAGLDRTNPPQGVNAPSTNFDFLLSLKLGKADFECAGLQVAKYADSSNSTIQSSAKHAVFIFTTLAALHDRSVREHTALLDAMSAGTAKPGTELERQATLGAAYDETWKGLIMAVVLGTYAIVEENPKTGTMSGLAMTRVERDAVLSKLRTTFGDGVTKGLQVGQLPLMVAAASLYKVVGDPKRQLRVPK